MPMISVTSTMKKSKTKSASITIMLNVISPVHHSHSHISRKGAWRWSARVRTL